MEGVRATGEPWDVEHRVGGVDGQWHPLLARGVPVRDEQGQVICWAGINLDISRLKQAEQALLRSEKLASVGRMAASIAHEINNPLAAVTNTSTWQSRVWIGPSWAQYLDMQTMSKAHSAYHRQTLGFFASRPPQRLVSVDSVMDSAVDLLQGKIRVKRATIEKQYDGDLQVKAVPGELRQVFSNLLANSLDAMDEEAPSSCTLPIDLLQQRSTPYQGNRCRQWQRHRYATLPRIFEPLFTTKEATGSGLGLWVSKQIIDKHHGSIRVHSSIRGPRRGTVFSILLPAYLAESVEWANTARTSG